MAVTSNAEEGLQTNLNGESKTDNEEYIADGDGTSNQQDDDVDENEEQDDDDDNEQQDDGGRRVGNDDDDEEEGEDGEDEDTEDVGQTPPKTNQTVSGNSKGVEEKKKLIQGVLKNAS